MKSAYLLGIVPCPDESPDIEFSVPVKWESDEEAIMAIEGSLQANCPFIPKRELRKIAQNVFHIAPRPVLVGYRVSEPAFGYTGAPAQPSAYVWIEMAKEEIGSLGEGEEDECGNKFFRVFDQRGNLLVEWWPIYVCLCPKSVRIVAYTCWGERREDPEQQFSVWLDGQPLSPQTFAVVLRNKLGFLPDDREKAQAEAERLFTELMANGRAFVGYAEYESYEGGSVTFVGYLPRAEVDESQYGVAEKDCHGRDVLSALDDEPVDEESEKRQTILVPCYIKLRPVFESGGK